MEPDQEINAESRQRALDVLIDRMLTTRAATAVGIVVDDTKVDAVVAQLRKQNSLSEEELETALEQQGYTLASYREEVAAEILLFKARNYFVRPSLVIEDAAIRARYLELAQKEVGLRSFSDLRDTIYDQLVVEGMQVKTRAWTKALRSEVIIDVRL